MKVTLIQPTVINMERAYTSVFRKALHYLSTSFKVDNNMIFKSPIMQQVLDLQHVFTNTRLARIARGLSSGQSR